MTSDNHFDFVVFEKSFGLNVTIKVGTSTQIIKLPMDIIVLRWIAPYKVTYNSSILNLNKSMNPIQLVFIKQ